MTDDDFKAGVEDAARHLGFTIVSLGVDHGGDDETVYRVRFDAGGLDASFEMLLDRTSVERSGATAREYVRWEILDAFREPSA